MRLAGLAPAGSREDAPRRTVARGLPRLLPAWPSRPGPRGVAEGLRWGDARLAGSCEMDVRASLVSRCACWSLLVALARLGVPARAGRRGAFRPAVRSVRGTRFRQVPAGRPASFTPQRVAGTASSAYWAGRHPSGEQGSRQLRLRAAGADLPVDSAFGYRETARRWPDCGRAAPKRRSSGCQARRQLSRLRSR